MFVLSLQESIDQMYRSIKFKPEQFNEYLLSKEVGFATCELIDTPEHESKGNLFEVLFFASAFLMPLLFLYRFQASNLFVLESRHKLNYLHYTSINYREHLFE